MSEHTERLYNRLQELKGSFSGYQREVDSNRRYYDLKFENAVVAPSMQIQLPPLMPTTARRAIDEAVDHILFTPVIRVPRRPTKHEESKEQLIAEKKRAFLNAWWSQVGLVYNALGDARKPLLSEGRVCVRKVIDWDLVPSSKGKSKAKFRKELDKLGKSGFLWDVQVLDNKAVFEDLGNHRDPRYVYIQYKIRREEAKALFPKVELDILNEGNEFGLVEYTEYWSYDRRTGKAGEHMQWIDGKSVHDEDNPYPYIPVVIEDAGYGSVTRQATPEMKYVGLTQFTHDIFVAEARQMSALQAVAEMTAFPMVKRRNMDDSKNIVVGPGNIIDLEGALDDPNREDIELVQWPDVPVTVLQLIQQTREMANATLKLDVLGGQPLRGVETATEANTQIANAAAKLSSPVAALERLVRRLTMQVLMDVELVLDAPISLFSVATDSPAEIRVKPTDIDGFYDVGVELATTDAEAMSMQKARFWLDAPRLSPFLSFETALERGGITDQPMAELEQRAAEDVFLSPQMQMLRILTGGETLQVFAQMVQAEATRLNGGIPGGEPVAPGAAGGAPAPNPQGGAGPAGTDPATRNAQATRDTEFGGGAGGPV